MAFSRFGFHICNPSITDGHSCNSQQVSGVLQRNQFPLPISPSSTLAHPPLTTLHPHILHVVIYDLNLQSPNLPLLSFQSNRNIKKSSQRNHGYFGEERAFHGRRLLIVLLDVGKIVKGLPIFFHERVLIYFRIKLLNVVGKLHHEKIKEGEVSEGKFFIAKIFVQKVYFCFDFLECSINSVLPIRV